MEQDGGGDRPRAQQEESWGTSEGEKLRGGKGRSQIKGPRTMQRVLRIRQ
jgi:hypothetical protein